MKNLLISGIGGKVGLHLKKLASNYGFNIICGVDKNTFIEADFPVYTTFFEVKEQVDFIIDFSSPSLSENAVDFALLNDCKLVCGTTNLTTKIMKKINNLSQKTAVCISSNFSVGMPAYINAIKILKQTIPHFDCSVFEIHNAQKKDAPSGTAKDILQECKINDCVSIRGGNVAGVHTTLFLGVGEEIEITHRAYDKSIFANGALKCAVALINKQKGLFKPCDLT